MSFGSDRRSLSSVFLPENTHTHESLPVMGKSQIKSQINFTEMQIFENVQFT